MFDWLSEIEKICDYIVPSPTGEILFVSISEVDLRRMARVIRELARFALKLEGIALYYNPTVRHERDNLSPDAKELLK